MDFTNKNHDSVKEIAIYDYSFFDRSIQQIDYTFLYELDVNYTSLDIGDIIFVKRFKYKDGRVGVNHLFLIISMSEVNDILLFYGMLISSKIEKIAYKYNQILLKDSKNNLRKDSLVKTDVIYKIFTKNILLKIGNIDKTKIDIYKNQLMQIN